MPQANFAYDFTFRITGDREVVAALDTMIMKGKEVVEGTRSTSQAMGAFSDELARTMKRFVTSQKDAARVSMEFLKTSNDVVSNLSAQSKAIMEQARRRGELHDDEVQQLLEINAKIQQHTDLIQKNSASLNVNSKEFEIHNRFIASNTSQMRQIDEFTGKYSSSVVQAKAAQQEFNSALRDFKDRATIISSEMQILIHDMDTGAVSARVGADSWEMYKGQLEKVINELREYIRTGSLSNDELARATSQLASLTSMLSNAQRGFAGTGSTMRGMNKVTSGANQLMLSFGDIVQDSAQFSFGFAQGARAIGNNIAFAAEQFVIMRANMVAAQGQTVTLAATMKALGGALMGPIGLIVLLNAVVTGVTMYATRQQRLNKELKDGAKAFDDIYKSLKNFSVGGLEFNLFEETNIGTQIVSLKAITDTIKLVKDEIEDTRNVLRRGGTPFEQVERELKPYLDGLESIVGVRNEIIEQFPILKDLDDAQLERFLELEKQSLDQQKVEQAKLELYKQQVEGGAEYIDFLDEIKELNQDLTLSEAQRELGLTNLAVTQEDAVKRFESLKSAILSMNLPTAMLNALLLELAETQRTLGIETQKAIESVELQTVALITSLGKTELQLFIEKEEQKRKEAEKTAKMRSFYERFYLIEGQKVAQQYSSVWNAHYGITDEEAEDSSEKQIASTRSILDATGQFMSQLMLLNSQKSQQNEKEARKQFETNKKLAYASAVVAGSAAIVEVMRDTKAGLVGRLIASGIMAAAVGVQIAQIRQQQFGGAGGAPTSRESSGGAESFGFQMNKVEGPQTFRTPGYMPENGQQLIQPKVDVKVMANRKQLYAMVKTGEEEYRQIKV